MKQRIGAVFTLAVLVGCGGPVTKDLTVTAASWERYVDVVTPKWVTEGGWEVPEHAEKTGEQKKVHHYSERKYYGPGMCWNFSKGTFKPCMKWQTKRDVPVEQTWYTYQIERYVPSRTLSKQGIDGEPQWPEVELQARESELQRREVYHVVFADEEQAPYSRVVASYQEWFLIKQKGRVRATVDPEMKTIVTLELK